MYTEVAREVTEMLFFPLHYERIMGFGEGEN